MFHSHEGILRKVGFVCQVAANLIGNNLRHHYSGADKRTGELHMTGDVFLKGHRSSYGVSQVRGFYGGVLGQYPNLAHNRF